MLIVRVVSVREEVEQMCVDRLGERHDCDDPAQHVQAGRQTLVGVKPVVVSDDQRMEWVLAPGRMYKLVEVPDGER